MALIKCTECGHVVSDKASMCPNCGCPINDEEMPHPWDAEANNTQVINKRNGRSNKWLYAIIALLVAVFADGGYYWYRMSKKDDDVKQFVAQFAQAVAAGDRQTICNFYPDAADADSLNFSYDEDTLQVIENNENEWKVTGVEGKEIIIARKEGEKTLYIKESHGVFAYPDTLFTMAKGTGWYDASLNDKQNAERLSDKDFISWMNKKSKQDLKSKLKVTKATSIKGTKDIASEFEQQENFHTFETYCTVIVANLGDSDIAGDDYAISAQEKWVHRYDYLDYDDYSDYVGHYKDTPMQDKPKTLTGKPIPAHETVTYTWKGHGSREAHPDECNINFHLNASVTLLPKGENSAKNQMTFTGKEYEEYLAEKGN